jgi:NADH-quinone oxidoreductase subunit J
VIMMLNLGEAGDQRERQWLAPRIWIIPALLGTILLVEMVLAITQSDGTTSGIEVTPKEVGLTLFGPYLLAVEIASMLLLAGLVGAYHLGSRFLDRHFQDQEDQH